MEPKRVIQRGQALLLYALLIPLLFLFLGVTLDMGWYYLNVSRLQNAADAAVIAGARAFVDDINTQNSAAKIFVTYNYDGLIVDSYPKDNPPIDSTSEINTNKIKGDEAAADYVLKNLSADDVNWSKPEHDDSYTIFDGGSRGNKSTITLVPSLYDGDETLYYVVRLNEKVEHLFLPGFFDAMPAPVVAIAMLTKTTKTETAAKKVNIVFNANGGNFGDGTDETSKEFTAAESMEDDEVSDSLNSGKGEPSNSIQKEFKGWSTTKNPSAGEKIVVYEDGKQLTKKQVAELFGDKDTVTLYAVWEEVLPTNNRTLWEQMHYLIAKYVYDPDWNVSVNKFGAALNDLNFIPTGNTAVLNNNKIVYITMAADTKANNSKAYVKDVDRLFLDFRPDGFIVRVHALINVNAAYPVRSGKSGDDPLYIRIEAEPKQGSVGNEPQQIIININADNTADSKRPLFFYYDGPLTYNGTYPDRIAQPVILNMTTDFKGVLFMPEVPVVIHGNGHKFEGFIVAKEFRYAATSGSKTAKYTQNGLAAYYYIDSNNNIQTVLADGDDALEIYHYNATNSNRFNLSSASQFKTFTAESNVNFMYVYYDYDCVMDSSPFYLNTGDLIPLYKLDSTGKQVRVTKWEDVNLYDSDNRDTRKLIPKVVTDAYKGTVRLEPNGEPKPLYDEAGNPIYFCEDYVRLTGTYTVFTLDRVADGTRDPKEFLLPKNVIDSKTKEEVILSNTDDWK